VSETPTQHKNDNNVTHSKHRGKNIT